MALVTPPCGVPYLMLGREGASSLVPGDSALSLPGHQAVEVQALSLCHGGRGSLDPDGDT